VPLRFVSICVVDEADAVQYEGKVVAEVDLIVADLRRVGLDIKRSVSKPARSPST
jgi:hypothetical protein